DQPRAALGEDLSRRRVETERRQVLPRVEREAGQRGALERRGGGLGEDGALLPDRRRLDVLAELRTADLVAPDRRAGPRARTEGDLPALDLVHEVPLGGAYTPPSIKDGYRRDPPVVASKSKRSGEARDLAKLARTVRIFEVGVVLDPEPRRDDRPEDQVVAPDVLDPLRHRARDAHQVAR